MLRVAITGGIACGKSLVTGYLREAGLEVIDADDIVHELVPENERRRLAAKVFADPSARKDLEAKLHPLVKSRIERFFRESKADVAVAVVPLLFEVRWDGEYDIICCVVSLEEEQIKRMIENRGYTREEALGRIAAQLPVSEKAAGSHYVITNDSTAEELRRQTEAFARWLADAAAERKRGSFKEK